MKQSRVYVAPTLMAMGTVASSTRSNSTGPYCDDVMFTLSMSNSNQMLGTCNQF